ncbi:MAG: hypothetical protein WAM14_01595 [Candidatus Nitrosopolaris sp.]
MTVVLAFISGFMAGLYITLLYQNQLQILGQVGTWIPIFGAIFAGVSAISFFYSLTKEPTLKFEGIVSRDVYYPTYNVKTKLYCLKVKRKGVGGADVCEGQIKVEDKDVDYYTTQWYNEIYPVISITMDEEFLKLFEVIDMASEKKIRFYSVRHAGGVDPIEIPYNDDNINKKIKARIGSKNARVPRSPFSKKISEIINDP